MQILLTRDTEYLFQNTFTMYKPATKTVKVTRKPLLIWVSVACFRLKSKHCHVMWTSKMQMILLIKNTEYLFQNTFAMYKPATKTCYYCLSDKKTIHPEVSHKTMKILWKRCFQHFKTIQS